MGRYIVKRLLLMIPIVIVVTILIFFIIKLIPGDPIIIMFGKNPNPEQIARIQDLYGLNDPLWTQYFTWIGNILQGNWGTTIQLNQPVLGLIVERLPRTLSLCIAGIVISMIIAIPTGILSAKKHNTVTDVAITSANLLFISIPGFWFGILLIIVLCVVTRLLPVGGYVSPADDFGGWVKCIIMPSLAMAASFFASLSRLIRSSMLEVMNQDYMSLARIKGNRERRVLYVHGLKNSLIPIVTTVGLQIGYFMGGEVVVEQVFQYPGMGMLLMQGINQRDYPLIQGTILFFALIIVVVNLLTDITYMFIDPKIKFGRKNV